MFSSIIPANNTSLIGGDVQPQESQESFFSKTLVDLVEFQNMWDITNLNHQTEHINMSDIASPEAFASSVGLSDGRFGLQTLHAFHV